MGNEVNGFSLTHQLGAHYGGRGPRQAHRDNNSTPTKPELEIKTALRTL